MARFGRAFPLHTKVAKAGVSNVAVTLSVTTAPVVTAQLAKTVTLLATTTVAPVITAIKLKALQVLTVTSATTISMLHQSGKGMILSVTSTAVPKFAKALRKVVGVAGGAISSTYATDVLSSSPDQYWRFQEIGGSGNVNYDSAKGFYMSTNTGVQKGVGGLIPTAQDFGLQFDGSTGSGSTGVTNSVFQNHDFSVEFWVCPFLTDGSHFIFSVGDTNNSSQGDAFLHIGFIGTTQLRMGFFGDDLDSVKRFSPNQTYHIVCTWSASTLLRTIYVNGVQDVSAASSGSLNVPSTALGQIGAVNFGSGNGPFFYSGVLAQLAVYPSVLDATTIARHYSEGTTGPSASSSVQVRPTITKGIGKFLGVPGPTAVAYIIGPGIVLPNFDGGQTEPPSPTLLNQTPTVGVIPGLFRLASPKATLTVQFRTFITDVIKRVTT